MNNPALILLSLTCLLTGTQVLAADGRSDYDLDDDGLIEINDLADLNEIRNNLDGTSLYGTSIGCPAGGCNGFELTADLDFDTNGDGQMNELDDWWNNGEGWDPIGKQNPDSSRFRAVFDGKGYQIRNLFIYRPRHGRQGLFGAAYSATFMNIALTGPLTRVTGDSLVGGVIGYSMGGSRLRGIYVSGTIEGTSGVGAAVGRMQETGVIEDIYSAAEVLGTDKIGGIAGEHSGSGIYRTLSVGRVSAVANAGAVVGSAISTEVEAVMWATDTAYQSLGPLYFTAATSALGTDIATLRCPSVAGDTSCLPGEALFTGWDSSTYINSTGSPESYWDFGSNVQLPAIRLAGVVFRDSDGDGALDSEDLWPANRAAAYDSDRDGSPERWSTNCDEECQAASTLSLDMFPATFAAWQDDDLDGQPESWTVGCNSSCQKASGLLYDLYPDDFDNDGLNTAEDRDDDSDGVEDADADSDGLIDIANLQELDAVRHSLAGTTQILTYDGAENSSGCPIVLYAGERVHRCQGYELTADLDFDTNGDGRISTEDDWWNDGEGWQPLGGSTSFTGIFDGRGHQIRNLYINRPGAYRVGLFAYAWGASLRNIAFTGNGTSVSGQNSVAILAANIDYGSRVSGIYVSGIVNGNNSVGALSGSINRSEVMGVHSAALVNGVSSSGGLIGSSYQSEISVVLVSGSVNATTDFGAIQGILSYSSLARAYWVSSVNGGSSALGSVSASSASALVGATSGELACPIAADDTVCKSGTVLFQNWGSFQYSEGHGTIRAYWDFGSATDLPALNLDGVVYRDSDGDGVINSEDAFPLDPNETIDTDSDGVGNNSDPDDDNDGVDDTRDVYPLDPGEWSDGDGDGVGDNADVFPGDPLEWSDRDGDGVGDNSDLFPDDATDWSDRDGDGIGDNGDSYPDDFDNDAVPDQVDPDNNADNGAPVLQVLSASYLTAVNDEAGAKALLSEADFMAWKSNIYATDAVDASALLSLHVSLNGSELLQDSNAQVELPVGLHEVEWTAIDSSGNVSSPEKQLLKVYPRIRFETAASITGENSLASVDIVLTGASPDYPISIIVQTDPSSTVSQEDLMEAFMLTEAHVVALSQGVGAEPATQAVISIPVVSDTDFEQDEMLVLALTEVSVPGIEQQFIRIDEANSRHVLTITQENLPPQVTLKIQQAGKETRSIDINAGEVFMELLISDPNGDDELSVESDFGALTQSFPDYRKVSFNPAFLPLGNHPIVVKVTDNGLPPLATVMETHVEVVDELIGVVTTPASPVHTVEQAPTGEVVDYCEINNCGGSLIWLLTLSPVLLATRRRRLAKAA